MIKKLLFSLVVLLSVMISAVPALAATNPYGQVDCSSAGGSAVCQGKGNTADPISGSSGSLMKVTNIVAWVAGMAAVLFVVLAGIKYITSQGDPQQISQAKQSIIYAAVGIVVIVATRMIIGFVLGNI